MYTWRRHCCAACFESKERPHCIDNINACEACSTVVSSGEYELKLLMDRLNLLTQGSPSKLKKIFDIKAHMTTDNYFNGNQIRGEGGHRGYGLLQTLGRGYLGRDDVKQHFHHGRPPIDQRSKAARYLTPIVAVKSVDPDGDALEYADIITSFQSTSSCNISAVNSINSLELYCLTKHRGHNELTESRLQLSRMTLMHFLLKFSRMCIVIRVTPRMRVRRHLRTVPAQSSRLLEI